MAPSRQVSVAQAAEILGVHPQRVHQRIRDGSLPAEKVGSQWVIDAAEVRRVRRGSGPGRPLSEKSAWDLLAVASSSASAAALRPPARSRARSRLRGLVAQASNGDRGADAIAVELDHALRNRARRVLFVGSSLDLADLRGDGRIHVSGLSLPESNLAVGDVVEGYVRSGALDALVEDYLLEPVSRSRANVIIHVASDDLAHPMLGALEYAARSRLMQAADLAEYEGVRERNEAVRLLAEVGETSVADGRDAEEADRV